MTNLNAEAMAELQLLLDVLPPGVRHALTEPGLEENQPPVNELIEVVLDLGRVPEARFLDGSFVDLGQILVTETDLTHLAAGIGAFSGDNRAGIPRTLHRISAIRNRQGTIVGLTCRVGKVVTGTIDAIRDLVLSGKSILMLGRPGVGKTTKLREMAKLLADEGKKRVIVVDTSNEIAGDGDIPHPAVGRARRMQVPSPEAQQQIMIEAVENHTPEVIVVDEIGTEPEALAARTIAERGVVLVATAHGTKLENLIKNPVISDLIGGIQTVTLGDEEAKRRSSQKTVLEREKQPTFDIAIEIRDRNTLAVYPNLAEAIDHLLRGWTLFPEVRKTDETGQTKVLQPELKALPGKINKDGHELLPLELDGLLNEPPEKTEASPAKEVWSGLQEGDPLRDNVAGHEVRVFLYGITRSFVDRIVERLDMERFVTVTSSMHDAHAVLALRGQARPGSKVLRLAADYEVPIYYAKTNTMPQIQRALREALEAACRREEEQNGGVAEGIDKYWSPKALNWLASLEEATSPVGGEDTELALAEAKEAIAHVLSAAEPVELGPRRSFIRRLQHELVEQHQLMSLSIGHEPNRRLKILPP